MDGAGRRWAVLVPPPTIDGALLPNLRSLPPFDFSFVAPFWQAAVITPSPQVGMTYAHIVVTGDRVELLERGYGLDHLDPDRIVATDGRGSRPPVELGALVTEQHRPSP